MLQDDANGELAVKNILKTGFGEFYKTMTRPERQELLHVFIRRIDVGSSFLTIHWSFSDDVARISRSKAMPKKGTVPETVACPIANTLTGETSVAGNEVVLSTTSQTGEVERLQKQVDNSRNTNSQTSIDEGSEKGKNVVEIGANRQSCGPSGTLLLRLILEVVLGSSRTADAVDGKLPKAALERLPQQP